MRTSTNIHSGWYPGGSYTQTCEDISFDPSTSYLQATCKQKNGAWNFTDLYLPGQYDDILNCDGVLTLNDC
jgi:hypothetical protein